MPRTVREDQAGLTHHVTSHALQGDCFFDSCDKIWFLQQIQVLLETHPVQIHAYALMSNHYHLMISAQKDYAVQRFMQKLQGRYARYALDILGRKGYFWRARYFSVVLRDLRHFYSVPLYIETNSWRAGIVTHPARCRWNSYRANAGLLSSPILNPHPEWLEGQRRPGDWHKEHKRRMLAYISGSPRFLTRTPLPPVISADAMLELPQRRH